MRFQNKDIHPALLTAPGFKLHLRLFWGLEGKQENSCGVFVLLSLRFQATFDFGCISCGWSNLSSWTSFSFDVSGFSHIAKTSSASSSVSVSRHCVSVVVSSPCNRYQTPECDSAARSRVSDTEDPFQGRDLTGFLHFSLQFNSCLDSRLQKRSLIQFIVLCQTLFLTNVEAWIFASTYWHFAKPRPP